MKASRKTLPTISTKLLKSLIAPTKRTRVTVPIVLWASKDHHKSFRLKSFGLIFSARNLAPEFQVRRPLK